MTRDPLDLGARSGPIKHARYKNIWVYWLASKQWWLSPLDIDANLYCA